MSADVTPAATGVAGETAIHAARRNRKGWLAGVAVGISLLVTLVAMLWSEGSSASQISVQADSYSSSAIGYRGLVTMLRANGISVQISKSGSVGKTGDGLLIIAEPHLDTDAEKQRFKKLIGSGKQLLLIAPKWAGTVDPQKPSWLASVALVSQDTLDKFAESCGVAGQLRRHSGELVSSEEAGAPATIRQHPTVLDATAEYEAYADTKLGALAAELDTGVLLTDPDVLNNHGLDNGRNAEFALALINELRAGGPVVIDETVHGYIAPDSMITLMTTFPFVIVTVALLLAVAIVVAGAAGRYGPATDLAPPFAAGKAFLIDNTAALLRYGGHDAEITKRYFAATLVELRTVLRVPRELNEAATLTWLDRVAATRRKPALAHELARAVAQVSQHTEPQTLLALAQRIAAWRQEMQHGTR